MTFKGVAPKDDDDRVRRNLPTFAKVPMEWDGQVRGPKLPTRYPWCLATLQWWEEFRRSPQSMVCVESDWSYLVDTALIYDRLWSNPQSLSVAELGKLANELRIRMGNYGDTWTNRKKDRIEIQSPQSRQAEADQIKADAQKAVDYMEILTKEAAKRKE